MDPARRRIGRAAAGLGLGAAASTVLSLAHQTPWKLVALGGTGQVVVLVLGAATVVAGILARPAALLTVGLAFLAAAVLNLVQISGTGANLLGGDSSTTALLFGFAVGLLALGLAPTARPSTDPATESR